jgi:hypothetical protein
LSDNNLNPGEARSYTFKQLLNTKGKFTLETKVTKHRMTEEAVKYNKVDKSYPTNITMYNKKHEFEVK